MGSTAVYVAPALAAYPWVKLGGQVSLPAVALWNLQVHYRTIQLVIVNNSDMKNINILNVSRCAQWHLDDIWGLWRRPRVHLYSARLNRIGCGRGGELRCDTVIRAKNQRNYSSPAKEILTRLRDLRSTGTQPVPVSEIPEAQLGGRASPPPFATWKLRALYPIHKFVFVSNNDTKNRHTLCE